MSEKFISHNSFRFQCRTRLCGWCNGFDEDVRIIEVPVSMPHAALWVVQHDRGLRFSVSDSRFNAARGFVGGAT